MKKSTARVPRRCFIVDLPGLLSTPMPSRSHNNVPATAAVSPLATTAETSAPRLVRLMGTVLSMSKNTPPPQSQQSVYSSYDDAFDDDDNSEDNTMLLELDDGTGIISCYTPMAMMERIVGLRVGHTIDCTGEAKGQRTMTLSPNNPNKHYTNMDTTTTATQFILLVESLLDVRENPSAAERLRWMEIMALSPQSQPPSDSQIAWCGYPSPRMTRADLLAVIESTVMVTTRGTTNNKTNNTTVQKEAMRQDDRGVTVANLALVLDLEPTEVQALVEDLQLDGLIYENEKGSFVPL